MGMISPDFTLFPSERMILCAGAGGKTGGHHPTATTVDPASGIGSLPSVTLVTGFVAHIYHSTNYQEESA